MAIEGTPIIVEDFDGEWQDYSRWFEDKMAAYHNPSIDPDAEDLTGALLQWQRGDGYAYYVVVDHEPLTISLIAIGDVWTVEDALIRGTNHEDVRQQIRAARLIRSIESR